MSRLRFLPLAATVALGSLPVSAPAQEVDLEALVAWPFPTDLTAAADAATVAWVRNAAGSRNVWVASGPDWTGRPITAFEGDDGQEITNVRISADGSTVAFVRGGAPNRAGELPNPVSDPDGVSRDVWIGSTEDGSAWSLGPGSDPVLSRDGSWLLLVDGGTLWRTATSRDTNAEDREALISQRGSPADLVLSPDESMVAWSSRRGTHAFLGVYDLDAGTLRWLDPSMDQDGSPAWSPDGSRIAYLRIPNQRERLPFIAVRETVPWSLRVVDVASGEASTVFEAPEGYGSAFQGISAANQIFWGAGDRIVFPWEGNGWTNLYSVPASGGEATALGGGQFEVQYVTPGEDGATVVFSSNQGDINRQHLWEAAVDGSRATQITAGDGIEWGPAVTGDGTLLFLASTGTVPAHAEVLEEGGQRSWLVDADPPQGLRAPEPVIFTATDGMQIHGQLFRPAGAPPPDGWPGLLFLHGGSRRQMLLGFHHRGYYHNTYAFNQYMASRGYVVLSVNYRSGIGYGLEFREALDYGAGGASEVRDVIGAGLYLAGRDDVDRDRIGLWGGSYGGYLTAHGLAQAPDLFQAGVDVHGVHDWNVAINNFVPSYDPAARPEFSRLAFESSPMAHLDDWRAPVLLIHGDDDRNVRFLESVELVEELRERDVHVEQLVFPDEVHGFLLHGNWVAAFEAAADFFDRFLGGDG